MQKRVINRNTITVLLISLFILFNLIVANWNSIELAGISAIRNSLASYNRNIVYKGHNWIEGKNVDVAFTEMDSDLAVFILELSQESFEELRARFNFIPNVRPLVVIYPSYKALLDSLGWDENNKVSGVYQSGTIKLVSPKEWYPVSVLAEIKNVYRNFGPVHHEMTHLFVDYLTNGNFPDWYTEALAQLEELKFLNIEWIDANNQNPKELYTFCQLNNGFYRLENQALAYRQSLTIAIFMVETFGDEVHTDILNMLSKGNSFGASIQKLYGLSIDDFQVEYNMWIERNWDKFF